MKDASLIEQAAKRLEELRAAQRGGVRVPAAAANAVPARTPDRREDAGPRGASIPAQAGAQFLELDLAYLASAGFITPDAPRSRIADEFRILKRPLLANAASKGPISIRHGNLIMVTSAVPSEGKTFCSINLAMSIALELDRSVLLVDADVAKPSLPKYFRFEPRAGLLDVLMDPARDLGSVLLRTNFEKLTVLPSGRHHARATELLASGAMAQLLDEMANRYSDRIVIFDSPPLLAATESPVLATQMGQIVVVVHAESTTARSVEHALTAIEACPVKMMVLNQVRTASQVGYGYGYGYGYGHEDGAGAAKNEG